MSNHQFEYAIYIRTTREAVWEALTSSEYTWQYWGHMAIESWFREGSAIKMVKENGEVNWHGRVLKAQSPCCLQFTWQLPQIGERAPEPESTVSIEVEPHGSLVRLTVKHDGFAPGSPLLSMVSQGWPAILSSLKTLLETGNPLEY